MDEYFIIIYFPKRFSYKVYIEQLYGITMKNMHLNIKYKTKFNIICWIIMPLILLLKFPYPILVVIHVVFIELKVINNHALGNEICINWNMHSLFYRERNRSMCNEYKYYICIYNTGKIYLMWIWFKICIYPLHLFLYYL